MNASAIIFQTLRDAELLMQMNTLATSLMKGRMRNSPCCPQEIMTAESTITMPGTNDISQLITTRIVSDQLDQSSDLQLSLSLSHSRPTNGCNVFPHLPRNDPPLDSVYPRIRLCNRLWQLWRAPCNQGSEPISQ